MRSPELASRFDREKWHSQLSPVLNLWKKLNQVPYLRTSFQRLVNVDETSAVSMDKEKWSY